MSLASSSPKTTLDRTCINMVKAENQPCNVTDDNQGPDCYESMHAFKKIRTSTSGLRKSPNKWTKEENQKLASLVASYGEKKWKRISAEMGGQKTGAQCAQHWKRVLSPEIRKGHWDENEEDLLLRLVVQYGSCWKKIAKKIPQRTDIQCRYQYLKAKQSREVMWDGKEDESLTKKVMEMANCNFFLARNGSTSPSSPSSSSSSSSSSTTTTTTTSSASRPALSSPSGSSGSGSDSGSLSSSPGTTSSPALSIKDINSPLSIKDINSPMSDSPVMAGPRFGDSPFSLRSSGNLSSGSPMLSSPSIGRSTRSNKDTDDSNLSSSSGSEGEEFASMKMSGEMSKNAWNDDKHNVNMTESTTESLASSWRSFSGNKEPSSLSESMCANCRSPFISHINKVVWLEISEHMARLKLTSTLRTALECKTRFTELLGNKIPLSTPNQFSNTAESIKSTGLKNSGGVGRSGFSNPLGGSGGIGNTDGSKSTFDNIGAKINNNNNNNNNKISTSSSTVPGYNGNSINLTNCNNNNITINITNSYTTNNTLQNGVNFQQLTHSASTPSNSSVPTKSEQTLMGPSHLLSKNPVSSILSPAPPFPSFTHLSHPTSFPQLPPVHQLKVPGGISSNSRNVHNGLESLAAVASILPREMLADYF